MKKTTEKKIIKLATNQPAKGHIEAPAPINHLAPIHEMVNCIRMCEVKLALLFDTITAKLAKLIEAAR